MNTRKELDVSKSYIYNIARYSMAAYGAGQAAWALASAYDKNNPAKMIKPSALLLCSLAQFLPDSSWTRYPMHIFKAIQNPIAWITQQSLGLTSHYAMQLVWNKLDPRIQNHPLAIEAAGVTQLGVDNGISRATQFVERRTDHVWQRAIWGDFNIAGEPKAPPELKPTAEISVLEKQQAELDGKVAETKNDFEKVNNAMSEWKQKIANKVNKWYGKGLCIIVEGREVLDPQQAIEHIAMKGNNGKKHRNIVFKDKFMGERHVSTITHTDPHIAAKFNEQNNAYQTALKNASANREALATARASQVFTEVRPDLISSSQSSRQSLSAVASNAIIPHPQMNPVQDNTLQMLNSLQQGNVINHPVQTNPVPVVTPAPTPIPATSPVQSAASANLSLFSNPKRQPKNQPVLDEAAINSLQELKEKVAYYALRSQKVKNGPYAGQLPSHLREIQKTIAQIENRECSITRGMQHIIAEAKLLGTAHPILKAANQCLGSITNHHYQRSPRCG